MENMENMSTDNPLSLLERGKILRREKFKVTKWLNENNVKLKKLFNNINLIKSSNKAIETFFN